MSVASEITRIKTAVSSAYGAVGDKGGTLPPLANRKVANLATAIASIPSGGGSVPVAPVITGWGDGQKEHGIIIGAVPGVDHYRMFVFGIGNYYSYATPPTFVDRNEYSAGSKTMDGSGFCAVVFSVDSDGVHSSPSNIVRIYGNDCLLAGTLVTLADGSQKPIEAITYEDELLVWNFDEGHLDKAHPFLIRRMGTNDEYIVSKFSNGAELRTTGRRGKANGHRVFDLDSRRFEYDTVSVGKRVFALGDKSSPVEISSEEVKGSCVYYNVLTERHMNLFANGLLTSCSMNNLYPFDRMEMKFVKDGRTPYDRSLFTKIGIEDRYIDGFRMCEQTHIPLEEVVSYALNIIGKDAANQKG